MEHILEDLSNPDIVQLAQPMQLSSDDNLIKNAYLCYQNIQKLQRDSAKMSELNTKLEDLNHKLIENIGSMKKNS